MRVVGADLRLSTEPCGNTPCYHFGRDLSALKRITDLLSLLLAHRAFFYPPLGGLPHFFSHIFGDRFATRHHLLGRLLQLPALRPITSRRGFYSWPATACNHS